MSTELKVTNKPRQWELQGTNIRIFTGPALNAGDKVLVIEFAAFEKAIKCLKKIADPRLRDHKEPDAYTELGCVMNMAEETLEELGANNDA